SLSSSLPHPFQRSPKTPPSILLTTPRNSLTQVFVGHETTFYCACTYAGNEVDLASCGYQPKKDPDRAKRLEWEHVVPAEAFGQSFPEWREGHSACIDSKGKAFKGRNCARKMAVSDHRGARQLLLADPGKF